MDGIVINAEAQGSLNPDLIAQEPGNSPLRLMSQKAVTDFVRESQKALDMPRPMHKYTYTGKPIEAEFYGYVADCMTMTGDTTATDAGTYPVTFTLNPGLAWINGSEEPVTMYWTIDQAAGICELSSASVEVVRGSSAEILVQHAPGTEVNIISQDSSIAAGIVTDTGLTISGKKNGRTLLTVSIAETKNYTSASATIVALVQDDPVSSLILVGDTNIPTSAWTNVTGGVSARIPIQECTADYAPQVVVAESAASTAITAGVELICESTNGAVIVYADTKPTAALAVHITLLRKTASINVTWG